MAHRTGPKQNNQGKAWTPAQETQMRRRVKGNTPTRLIADALGRTENAVQSKASDLNVSLKPTNQSPYNRRKK